MHSFIPSEFIDLMIKYNEVGPEADDEYWPIEYSSNTYISWQINSQPNQDIIYYFYLLVI